MSRCPNIVTLGQREEEVNKWPTSRCLNVATPQRRDASTSRRLNVATPQRRDATTSRRHNVATPQRRDASTSRRQRDLCLNIIKREGTRNRGWIRKRTDEGTESRAATTQISGEDTYFCIFFFSERLLMVYRLIKCITKSSMF